MTLCIIKTKIKERGETLVLAIYSLNSHVQGMTFHMMTLLHHMKPNLLIVTTIHHIESVLLLVTQVIVILYMHNVHMLHVLM